MQIVHDEFVSTFLFHRDSWVLHCPDKGGLTVHDMCIVGISVHCKNSGVDVTPKCPKPWCCCYTMVSLEHYGVG